MKLADKLESGISPIWKGAFYAAGLIGRRNPGRWEDQGGRQVLIIAPHPDDEAVGCAGTLLLHARSGDAVSLVYLTDGARSRAHGLDADRMRTIRKREAEAVAQSLRAAYFEWIGLPEGTWTFEDLAPQLLSVFRRRNPDIIYAPSRVDFHPEHHKAAHALARVLSSAGSEFANALVRVYQLQVPLTSILTDLVADCSSVSDEAEAALRLYQSQSANMGRAVRMWRYSALSYGIRRHAEEFWQMGPAQYCRLHSSSPESWHSSVFRGIRYRSFSDPLAYLSGLRERRRLRSGNLVSS